MSTEISPGTAVPDGPVSAEPEAAAALADASAAEASASARPVDDRPKDAVARGSLLMASGSLVSRVLGVVRNSMLVAVFGAMTAAGDAYQVANTLPTTVYMLLAAGVINAVFVPQFTKAAQQEDGGRSYVDRLLTLSLLSLLVVTAVAIPASPLLVRIFASQNWAPETLDLSVRFALVVMPAIFFYGLYAVLGQVLNARNRFGAYGWAPALANVVWLVGLGAYFVLYRGKAPGFGERVEDWSPDMVLLLGGTLTLGVALQALVLLVPLLRSGWRYTPRFGFRGVGLGSAGRVAGWTLAGVAVTQAALAVASRVLTSVDDGAGVGRLGYDNAFFIFMTPHGLITVSLATALFTAMSRAAGRRDLAGVRAQLRRGLRLIGVATIPTTIAGLCLAAAGMAILFPSRPLTETRSLADVLLVLILALLPYGVLYLVQRAFYAFEDARTPFYLSLIAAVVFAGGSLLAMAAPPGLRAVAVAGGAVLSDLIAAVIGLRWVTGRLGGMRLVDVADTWTRALFASLVAGLATLLVVGVVQAVAPNRLGALLMLLLGGGVFVVGYVGVGRWLRIRELDELLGPVLRRLPRQRRRVAATPAAPTGHNDRPA